jgi:hypothetical protein
LQKQKLDSDTLDAFRKEVAIMSKLRQPHLLLFMYSCSFTSLPSPPLCSLLLTTARLTSSGEPAQSQET